MALIHDFRKTNVLAIYRRQWIANAQIHQKYLDNADGILMIVENIMKTLIAQSEETKNEGFSQLMDNLLNDVQQIIAQVSSNCKKLPLKSV